MSTRCASGKRGIGISRWRCWRTPPWWWPVALPQRPKGGLIGYSVPEIRRVLNLLGLQASQLAFHLQWSRWRQQHQWQAKQAHIQRRTRHLASDSSLDLLPAPLAIAGLLPLTPAHWERIARLLPPQRLPTGRPATDHRQIIEGMLWVMRKGTSWRQMPKEFGPWQIIYSRFQRWKREGLWEQIRRILLS